MQYEYIKLVNSPTLDTRRFNPVSLIAIISTIYLGFMPAVALASVATPTMGGGFADFMGNAPTGARALGAGLADAAAAAAADVTLGGVAAAGGTVAGLIGAGVVGLCIGSYIEGSDACGAGTAIGGALGAAGIHFDKSGNLVKDVPGSAAEMCQDLAKFKAMYSGPPYGVISCVEREGVTCQNGGKAYDVWRNKGSWDESMLTAEGCTTGAIDPTTRPATPDEVGGAIAANPAAAAAYRAAAAAAAVGLLGTDAGPALKAAARVAAAAASSPPATRDCANGLTLQKDGTCLKTPGETKPKAPPKAPVDPNDLPDATKNDWPAFCTWAKVVCDFIDYAKQAPDAPQSGKVTITQKDVGDYPELSGIDIDKNRLNWSAACPAPYTFDAGVLGQHMTFSFSYDPFCQALAKIRPVVIAMSYLSGAYIVVGAGRKDG